MLGCCPYWGELMVAKFVFIAGGIKSAGSVYPPSPHAKAASALANFFRGTYYLPKTRLTKVDDGFRYFRGKTRAVYGYCPGNN